MDSYIREEKIGRGAMGDVYAGRHRALGRPVAIKIIKPALAEDEEFVRRFFNEARCTARFDHPNIARVYDAGTDPDSGLPCMVMERLIGTTLQNRIKQQGALPVADALKIADATLSALQTAHSQQIVHRDIKPGNIFLCSDGGIKVMDFGIARALDEEGLTSTGVQMGTPEYMSPEQIQGDKVDARSDLYCVGVLLYEMLSGDVPFRSDTRRGVQQMHLSAPLPPLPPNVPAWLRGIVAKATAKQPSARFATAAAMREALQTQRMPETPFVPKLPDVPPLKTQGAGTVPPSHSPGAAMPGKWPLLALAGVVGVLFLGLALRGTSTPPPQKVIPPPVVDPYMTAWNQQKGAEKAAEDTVIHLNRKQNPQIAQVQSITELSDRSYSQMCQDDLGFAYNSAYEAVEKANAAPNPQDISNAQAHGTYANVLMEVYAILNDPLFLAAGKREAERCLQLNPKCELGFSAQGTGLFLEAAAVTDEKQSKPMYQEALKKMQQAIDLNPNLAYFYNQRGIINDELKNREQAEADFKIALKYDPNIAWAQFSLTDLYVGQARWAEANTEFHQLEVTSPAEGKSIQGEVQVIKKQWQNALMYYNEAIALAPDYPTYHLYAADMLYRLKREDEARAEAAKAKELGIKNNWIYKTLNIL